MNRKLIRPNLAEVKSREPVLVKEPNNFVKEKEEKFVRPATDGKFTPPRNVSPTDGADGAARRKMPPPSETNAEIFYYKKQIDSHTLMTIVLQDGEKIEGTIEWYDLNALKVNRKNAPNLMLFKHNIKYMYKAEDFD